MKVIPQIAIVRHENCLYHINHTEEMLTEKGKQMMRRAIRIDPALLKEYWLLTPGGRDLSLRVRGVGEIRRRNAFIDLMLKVLDMEEERKENGQDEEKNEQEAADGANKK